MQATEVADLGRLSARLAAAVRDAGELALSRFRKPMKIWTKGPTDSPVCEVDVAVDELLQRRLGGGDEGIAWLSEESVDDPARLAARRVWIVDPIDGTRAYISGHPDWAVSAALIEDGRPVVACLYAAAHGEFFAATSKAGASRNGAAMTATAGRDLVGARVAGPRNLIERLAAVLPPVTILPRVRSLALRLTRVADGTCDVAFAGGNSHDWDLAAADLLVHEAGGALTALDGGAVAYNRPVPRHGTLVAAGRDRHAALIALLGDGRLALP